MTASYFTLLHCSDFEKEMNREELLEALEERVKHLFDSHSRTPMLDDYLAPKSLCTKGKITFGAENPDAIVKWASEMETNNKNDAWTTVRNYQVSIAAQSVEQSDCFALSKAFELLGGTANEETNYLLIDEFDLICPWPDMTHLQDITNKPEQWALCRIEFQSQG